MRFRLLESGRARFRRKFAWWPIVVENHRVWLEFYWAEEIVILHKWTIQRRFLD